MKPVKRILAIVLSAFMLSMPLPQSALAADGAITAGGTYALSDYGNGSIITVNAGLTVTLEGDGTTYTNVRIVCGAGVSLTLSNVNINNSTTTGACALSFTGAGNTLALASESTLSSAESQPGVRVESGTELTIDGGDTDKLTVTGGKYAAGIGGGDADYSVADGGSIIINGGTVIASSSEAAGIGGGYRGGGGSVVINGGAVTASSTRDGAGIGGGYYGNGGSVRISGGRVEAKGGIQAAGIGGGNRAGAGGSGGTVEISGGSVTATGGSSAAGIGGGCGSLDGGAGATVTISGGTVTAAGGTGISGGAGIGGGGSTASVSGYHGGGGGTVKISGGSVTATGGSCSAGIGGGSRRGGNGGSGGDVTLSGGLGVKVTISGGTYTLSGGTVTATGKDGAPGIGGGVGAASQGTLVIELPSGGGEVVTDAGYGGGIEDNGDGTYTVGVVETGYVIDKLKVDGVAVPAAEGQTNYTVTGAAKSVIVTFAYTVNFPEPAHGTLSVTSAEGGSLLSGNIVRGGRELTIKAAPYAGYALTSLTVNGVDVTGEYDAEDGYAFTVGAADTLGAGTTRTLGSRTASTQGAVINAAFEAAYSVTYDGNSGTGTAPTESNKAKGATFAAAAADSFAPPEGKQFKEWNTAFDGTGGSYPAGATVTMPGNDLTLYAIWENIPVSVDITWGSMEFTYSDGTWNPGTHEYEGGGWKAAENANRISVTSTSNIPVTVSCSYAQETGYSAVSGGFTDGTNPITSSNLPAGNTVPQSCDVFLILSGKPPEIYISKIGSVTITITE